MKPILITLKAPAWLLPYFGPKSALFPHWQSIAVFFAASFMWFMWVSGPSGLQYDGTEPVDRHPKEEKSTALIWLAGLLALGSGICLALIGLAWKGGMPLHTYGVLVSGGFLMAIMLCVHEARRIGADAEQILDLAFWILVSAIIGSRLLHIVTEWHSYWLDLQRVGHWTEWKLLRFWEGGLVFYGGFLGATFATWWFTRKTKINFWKTADIIAPALAVGQFFGRLGCFSAGCCYGKEAPGLPWGVTFTQGMASLGKTLHPTQLYESTGHIFIFLALIWIRSRKRYHGQVLAWYLMLYPVLRFTVEFFRGDVDRRFLFQKDITPLINGVDILSTSQFISILLFILGLIMIATLHRNDTQTSS